MGLLRQGPGVFFLFVALVLLILVSVSVPIANWLYFLEATIGTERVRLGQWGWCTAASGSDFSCSTSRLGYNADDVVDAVGGDTGRVSGAVIKGLTYALVLHPIAAAFALVALLVSLTTNVCLDICGSLISFFAFLVCLVALICDSVLFVTARHRINDELTGSPASLSNAYWLVVVATICLFLASILVCFGSASARRAKHNRNSTAAYEAAPTGEKRHFWNRS